MTSPTPLRNASQQAKPQRRPTIRFVLSCATRRPPPSSSRPSLKAKCRNNGRTATRSRTCVRRAVAWTPESPEMHRAHGCEEIARTLTRQTQAGAGGGIGRAKGVTASRKRVVHYSGRGRGVDRRTGNLVDYAANEHELSVWLALLLRLYAGAGARMLKKMTARHYRSNGPAPIEEARPFSLLAMQESEGGNERPE